MTEIVGYWTKGMKVEPDTKEQIRRLVADLSTDDLIEVYRELVKTYGERVIPPDHNS